jgi:hypothetical protein
VVLAALLGILYEKAFKLKPSDDAVYHTNSFILLVETMKCSKLHGQKIPIYKSFHTKPSPDHLYSGMFLAVMVWPQTWPMQRGKDEFMNQQTRPLSRRRGKLDETSRL